MCYALISCRRHFKVFGKAEKGGPTLPKNLTALFLFLLWIIYIRTLEHSNVSAFLTLLTLEHLSYFNF